MKEAKVARYLKTADYNWAQRGLNSLSELTKTFCKKIQIYKCRCALSVCLYPLRGTAPRCGRRVGCECIDAWTINSERLDTPASAVCWVGLNARTRTLWQHGADAERERRCGRSRYAEELGGWPTPLAPLLPLAMKAGIHSTLPLRLCSLWTKRCTHSSLFRSWKARCTTEGFHSHQTGAQAPHQSHTPPLEPGYTLETHSYG